jgi:3-hydroxyisobutyrate dehydrogenase
VAWLFYDRDRKIQLRLRSRASLHRLDPLAGRRWSESTTRSRVCYSTPLAPGTRIEYPVSASADSVGGRENFTVLSCEVHWMDLLYLSAAGHRRALLRWEGGSWDASWVAA